MTVRRSSTKANLPGVRSHRQAGLSLYVRKETTGQPDAPQPGLSLGLDFGGLGLLVLRLFGLDVHLADFLEALAELDELAAEDVHRVAAGHLGLLEPTLELDLGLLAQGGERLAGLGLELLGARGRLG